MELNKKIWNKQDIKEFQEYLKTFQNTEKIEWCKNMLQTNLPLLAMKTADIKYITNEIYKGNYYSFLDYMLWDYYENTAINGFLISKIKDFDIMEKYLDIYSDRADNWATCDLVTFKLKNKEKEYFELAQKYVKSDKPFVKRIGIDILFNILNSEYIDKILATLNTFKNEEHYYVNMVNAWLLCDCFIKQRKKTLNFFKNNNLNKFTQNKAIQKCRESRRVSTEDKEMLLKFKRK